MDGVIVISGGGTGIGAAIARTVARAGAHALILGRREPKLRSTVDEITAEHGDGHASWIQADVSEPEDVARVAATAMERHGTIAGIVNNAGGSGEAPAGPLTDFANLKAHWHHLYDSNMVTAVLLTEALAPMLRRPGGRIVNISSMTAEFGSGDPAYLAAKGALNAWTRSLTYRYGSDGITANAVVPGLTTDTEYFGGGPVPVTPEVIRSRYPSERLGTPADVAGVVGYLLSAEASFVTRQLIEVTGGALPPAY